MTTTQHPTRQAGSLTRIEKTGYWEPNTRYAGEPYAVVKVGDLTAGDTLASGHTVTAVTDSDLTSPYRPGPFVKIALADGTSHEAPAINRVRIRTTSAQADTARLAIHLTREMTRRHEQGVRVSGEQLVLFLALTGDDFPGADTRDALGIARRTLTSRGILPV